MQKYNRAISAMQVLYIFTAEFDKAEKSLKNTKKLKTEIDRNGLFC